ncbi:HEAT repeat domain-containing protein [Parasynechococcus marenigrum]|nr:HEAT repeat domain-containing protein [Parasynechococcus marenigrum]
MLPQADRLSETLRRHCALVGWQPRHLPAQGAATEPQLLEELIDCREAERADLSLELIKIADLAGWQSPWLEDNRARALVHQQQSWRAAAIWRKLQAGEDSGAAAAAVKMLSLVREQFDEQGVVEPELLELAEEGSPPPALQAVLQQALNHQRSTTAPQTHRLLKLAQQQGWIKASPSDPEPSSWQEIQELWRGAQQHPDPTIQSLATDALELHNHQSREAAELENQLIQSCLQAGWPPRHLGQTDRKANPGMDRVLLEIVACRECGASLLSQRLIQRCHELGCSSPWLEDNAARLLQGSDRQAARTIWQHLLNSDDPEVRNTAAQALGHLVNDEQEALLLEAITATREQGQQRPWRPLLRQRLLERDGSTSPSWRREAIQLPMQAGEAWDLHLRRHRLAQQLAREQLELLEQQLLGAS